MGAPSLAYKSSLKCKAKGSAKKEQQRKYVFQIAKHNFFHFKQFKVL
jgi:hypothetical protein